MKPIGALRMRGAASAIGATPSFVTSAYNTATGVSSIGLAYPAGIAAGDVLFLAVNAVDTSGSARPSGAPSGWNTADGEHFQSSVDEGHALYWRRADGTESGTVTVALSESVNTGIVVARMSVWRGCTASGTPYERLNFHSQTATTAHRAKGLSTAGPNRRVVSLFFCNGSATSGSNVNGWNEDVENSTTGYCWSTNSIAQAAAGKVAGCQRTMAANVTQTSWTFALVPTGEAAGADDPFAKVLLQAQFIGANGSTAFADDSHYNHQLVPFGNAQIQGNKLELDGSGDYVVTSTTVRELWRFLTDDFTASDDFTIDVFGATVDSLATTQDLVSFWDSSAGHANNRGWVLQILSTGHVSVQYSTNGTTTSTLIDYAAGIAAGSTHDYRVVRSVTAGEVYLYLDGTKVATATFSAATNFFASDSPVSMGANQTQGTPAPMDGRISAVRIMKGALSTGASYTVESLPLATS